jgi:hypothetical protein
MEEQLIRLVRNGAERLGLECTPALERLAVGWLREYLRSAGSFHPYFWACPQGGGHYFRGGDAAPLVLLAGHREGCPPAAAALEAFVRRTARDVEAALRDRDGLAGWGVDVACAVRAGLEQTLKNLLAEDGCPPTVHWLRDFYAAAFTGFDLPGPAELPAWWYDEILDGPPLPPFLPPGAAPEEEAEAGKGEDEESLDGRLDAFVAREGRGNNVLCRLLGELRGRTVPLRRLGEAISALLFLFLRYRVWLEAEGSGRAANQPDHLREVLRAGGYTNARGDEVLPNCLDQVLCRLREQVRGPLRAAQASGELPVPDGRMEDWLKGVFPRPWRYQSGGLFPPLP